MWRRLRMITVRRGRGAWRQVGVSARQPEEASADGS
jgi:hypothetical protein